MKLFIYPLQLLGCVVLVAIMYGAIAGSLKGGEGKGGRAYQIQRIDDDWRVIGHIVKYEGKTYLFNTDGGIIEHKNP